MKGEFMNIIENVQISGLEAAIRGMRNPLQSHKLIDSKWEGNEFKVGEKDLNLMKRLYKAGPEHAKYLRMIHVQLDITAPVYAWAEIDTYKVATVRNSYSFMHKGISKPFTLDDFSFPTCGEVDLDAKAKVLETEIVHLLNLLRGWYKESKSDDTFELIRSILPSGYMIKATYDMSLQTLLLMYSQRHNHRLSWWRDFCEQMRKGLPLMDELLKVNE